MTAFRWPQRVIPIALLAALAVCGQGRRIVAIAHRGEHLHHPENTIPAFEEAIRVGADFIEVDVRTTSDGTLVLSHDATVDRCTNGKGKVSELTFEQVEALDAGGARIPSFDQVLDVARGRIGVYVDVKDATAADVVNHIVGRGMAEHVVIYCNLEIAKQIHALNAKLTVMPEAGSVERARLLIEQLNATVVAFGASDFKAGIIAAVKEGHARIYVDRMGATDTAEGWQAAIDAGADGVQTDRPAALAAYLREKGYR
jgi:glycerophosphoryl diester phosphodiesterase